MSVASASTFRARCHRSIILSSYRFASTSNYAPLIDDVTPPSRHPRPKSPLFFTGRPRLSAEMTFLETLLQSSQDSLRRAHIFPLPNSLSPPQLPGNIRWKNPDDLTGLFGGRLKMSLHRRLQELLNELNRIRYLAELGGKPEVADKVAVALGTYLRDDGSQRQSEEGEEDVRVDEYGRAYGVGRRKEASARVWIIPSPNASELLDAPAGDSSIPTLPTSEILVNHLLLPQHFQRPHDRETILRPLRITGLIGAYNVFALVRGGGTTGQAGAVALGLAKALDAMREDVHEVLIAGELSSHDSSCIKAERGIDGALLRDPRATERKKTGMAKARKRVSSRNLSRLLLTDCAVHLGQALSIYGMFPMVHSQAFMHRFA